LFFKKYDNAAINITKDEAINIPEPDPPESD
jgi:hypothetical protein